MEANLSTSVGRCECGCGGITNTARQSEPGRGFRKGDHRRYLRGHHRRKRVRYKVEDRGWVTECYITTLATNNWGYGPHRREWERVHGPIGAGMTLHHECEQTDCIRLDHLREVTQAENSRLGSNTKLTNEDVRAIRSSEETQDALARRYGISQGQVSRIRSRRSWCDLE